jgi:aryl-alcohol dehydrogenase-like predicted oxidoreductase
MQQRTLGATSLSVSALSFGAWGIVGGLNWGHQEKADSLAALRAAYDAGMTTFDTAEMYGNGYSEQLIAEALGPVRDRIVIASKVLPSNFAEADLRTACERSLKNLGTSWIDLYQLHWPNWDLPIEVPLRTLEVLRQEGKIRAYGVSNFGPLDLRDALRAGFVPASNQVAYNLVFRAVEYAIQPACVDAGVSILCYSPLLHGLLTGKFRKPSDVPEDRARTRHFASERWAQARHGQPGCEDLLFDTIQQIRTIAEQAGEPMGDVALAWLLSRPGVASVVVGGRNAEQARRNVRAADLALKSDVVEALDRATAPLKETMGPNPDMWQATPRIR